MSNDDKSKLPNPYLDGRLEWLERYGSYISRAKQWQITALICLCITLVSIICNSIQATQAKVVPYVVEVDKFGQMAAVNRASDPGVIPTRVIQATLSDFVVNWRTVTPDLDLQKKMVERLSFYVAASAKGWLRQWFSEQNPYDRAKNFLVQVYIKSVPAQVSTDSWRVEWDEITRNHAGVQISSETYQATLTIQVQAPTTDAQIIRNPGGVYVTAISSSTIMDPNAIKAKK